MPVITAFRAYVLWVWGEDLRDNFRKVIGFKLWYTYRRAPIQRRLPRSNYYKLLLALAVAPVPRTREVGDGARVQPTDALGPWW